VVVSEFGEETAAVGMTLVAGEGVLKAAAARCQHNESPPRDGQALHGSVQANDDYTAAEAIQPAKKACY
jgi:hypothetical protein